MGQYNKERASLVAQRVKRLPAMQETQVKSLGQEDSPGEENGNPLQYFCLENPMDGEAWWATVHGVAKSRTQLSDFTHSLIIKKAILMMQERDRRTARIQCTSGELDLGAQFSHSKRREARAYRDTFR